MTGCTKFCHQTRASAEEHRDNLIARSDEHPQRASRIEVYYHKACFAWHVGHRATPTQKRQRQRGRRD